MIDLHCHEETPVPWVRAIRVSAGWTAAGALSLCYRLDADLDRIVIPAACAPERSEGLWRHTCCEAFVMGDAAPAYREFNFSPSGAWQAYDFAAYRQGGPLAQASAPRIVREEEGALSLNVLLPPQDLPPGRRLRIGLSAVIEAAAGGVSYWALRHPPGRPDFHHPDCFALELVRP
jgi:hypothetical protein